MAGPVATFVQLPTDAGNTGKKVRTQSLVVGPDTVHHHFFVPTSVRKVVGMYYFNSGILTGHTTAHNGTGTAYFWLEMPTGQSIRARLRRMRVILNNGASIGADVTTISRYALARFTFTGAASGATITPAKRHLTSDTANVANIRTASTGMTITLGAIAWSTINPAIEFTTSGIFGIATEYVWDPVVEDEYMDIGSGEGLLFYGPDAGVAQWRLSFNGVWDEYDNA